jgi:hypothetical protein
MSHIVEKKKVTLIELFLLRKGVLKQGEYLLDCLCTITVFPHKGTNRV